MLQSALHDYRLKGEEERLVGCVADGAQALGRWEVFDMPALGSWDFGVRCDSRDGVGDGGSEVSEFAVMVARLRIHVAEEVFDFGVVDSKEGFGDEIVVWWEEAQCQYQRKSHCGSRGAEIIPNISHVVQRSARKAWTSQEALWPLTLLQLVYVLVQEVS